MTSFVLLHGAWHGGWCWARVAPLLRARGHHVLTPTQTGLGERAHLLHAGITVDTFVQDLVGVLRAEELEHAVLVGHSMGGVAITGAADQVPERVRSLIYLDSRILENGESVQDQSTPELAAARSKAAAGSGGVSLPPPPASAFGIPDGPDADWVTRRMTPHPFGTMTSVCASLIPSATACPARTLPAPRPSTARWSPHAAGRAGGPAGNGASWRPATTRW